MLHILCGMRTASPEVVVRSGARFAVGRQASSYLPTFLLLGTLTMLGLVFEPHVQRLLAREARAGNPPTPTIFHSNRTEHVPFADCAECAQCGACRECYHGVTSVYEHRFDSCPYTTPGPCSFFGRLAWCPRRCAAFIALGVTALNCTQPTLDSFCAARDAAVPVARGRDTPAGLAQRRPPPSVYLPAQYHSPGHEQQKFPLLVWLCSSLTCANICFHYLAFRQLADAHGYIFVGVDSALDAGKNGRRFCHPVLSVYYSDCPEAEYDDTQYIWSVIEEVRATYHVSEVLLGGWSNGAATALGLARIYGKEIAAVVAVSAGRTLPYAGDEWKPMRWPNSTYAAKLGVAAAPVPTLLVHVPSDQVVHFSHAVDNLAFWAAANGCDLTSCPVRVGSLDLIREATGLPSAFRDVVHRLLGGGPRRANETERFRLVGCGHEADVELWSIDTFGALTTGDIPGLWQGVPGFARFQMPNGLTMHGHLMAWYAANDRGEEHALTRRIVEWMMTHRRSSDGVPSSSPPTAPLATLGRARQLVPSELGVKRSFASRTPITHCINSYRKHAFDIESYSRLLWGSALLLPMASLVCVPILAIVYIARARQSQQTCTALVRALLIEYSWYGGTRRGRPTALAAKALL